MGALEKALEVAVGVIRGDAGVFATWFLWAVLLARRKPVVPTVAFGDFVADVERGDVRDVSGEEPRLRYSVPKDDGRRVEEAGDGAGATIAPGAGVAPEGSSEPPTTKSSSTSAGARFPAGAPVVSPRRRPDPCAIWIAST